jgi:hypothetical protein
MTYREVPGFVNVLYAFASRRDGKPLGGTEFANCTAPMTNCRPRSRRGSTA